MSSAAQADRARSRTRWVLPPVRCAAAQLSLRGAAIVYLGAMIALPVAAIIVKGFGDGLGLHARAGGPGAMGGDPADADHRRDRRRHQRRDGHAARLRPGALPVPRPVGALGGRRPADRDPHARDRRDARGALRAERADRRVPRRLGIQVHLRAARHRAGAARRHAAVRAATVQPVLLELDPAEEEASATLGASGWTTFRKVVLPRDPPAIAAGALLSFARRMRRVRQHRARLGQHRRTRRSRRPSTSSSSRASSGPRRRRPWRSLLFAISFVMVLVTARLAAAQGGGVSARDASATAPPRAPPARARRPAPPAAGPIAAGDVASSTSASCCCCRWSASSGPS